MKKKAEDRCAVEKRREFLRRAAKTGAATAAVAVLATLKPRKAAAIPYPPFDFLF